jgi:micrococcal nuclease
MIVENVLSGDTVILVSARPGLHVQRTGLVTARLLAVDAPNFGITDECFAEEAQAKLASLLPEGTVAWVSVDQVEKDEGGRYFVYLWSADGRFVNYELTLGGFARALDMGTELERWQAIAGGQQSATGRLRGIWGSCGA